MDKEIGYSFSGLGKNTPKPVLGASQIGSIPANGSAAFLRRRHMAKRSPQQEIVKNLEPSTQEERRRKRDALHERTGY